MEFIEFCDSEGSKTLKFLRNYRCFWHARVFAKKARIKEFYEMNRKIHFCIFLAEFTKNARIAENGPDDAWGPQKSLKFHYVYKHLGAVAARVRTRENAVGNVNCFLRICTKYMETHENRGFSMKIMILGMSKHQVFLRNYLTFLRYPTNFWGILSIFAQIWWNLAIFRFWGPKMLFWAQNGTPAPPAQNPL